MESNRSIDIEFTDEERRYIELMSLQSDKVSASARILYNVVFYLPAVALGIYGIFDASLKIVGVAFVTLVCSMAYAFTAELHEARYTMLAHSIFRKMRARMENAQKK
ncbi:hypothetical protein HRR99_07930 [Agrobacterium vaccinii]|uniref:hypothetical protein n=1 Tax=Agrobacterium vaccinii TaxID=2735528 RepID=UPI001E5E59BE|nr:hypothetical protein [Agrobacterium vaccinii]UHS61448.1 hypothetical protein HRR99_07930 [Agrobacterium vaccinii]